MRQSAPLIGTVVATGCFFAASANAAECRTDWRAQLGENATGVMWATSGQRCTAPIYTGFGVIRGLRIVSRPKYGIASANGLSTFSYTSKPGFVGRDSFVVAIDGQSPDGTQGRTTVAALR